MWIPAGLVMTLAGTRDCLPPGLVSRSGARRKFKITNSKCKHCLKAKLR
jgi:hypothetical protein